MVLLCFAAFVGLTSWPFGPLSALVSSSSLYGFVVAFSGYAWLLCALFWASAPGIAAQRFVFFSWPVVSLALWWGLHRDVAVGWLPGADVEMPTLLGVGMAMPAQLALLWRVIFPQRESSETLESGVRWLLLMLFLFVLVPRSALDLTVSLHPLIYDFYALKFDVAAGLNITPWVIEVIQAVPGFGPLVSVAYGLTPLAFLALVLLQLRGRPAHLPNAILLWVVLTFCALVAYHFFPITGPKYIFGSEGYLAQLSHPETLPLQLVAGALAPRNGMPSMHFGWMFAATLIWCLSDTRRLSRWLLGLMTFSVALATLYLGEHYFVDLIVAVPFVLAVIALCSTGVSWAGGRAHTVVLGFGCWLVWVLLLRSQMDFFIASPWACWALIGLTGVVVWLQIRALLAFRAAACVEAAGVAEVSFESARPDGRLVWRLGLMFFASGAAALIYQVLFAKELALVFGSTSTATFTVLATFLGGMAIGSLIGGVIAARVRRPIAAYAFVELAIGGFCVATPVLFSMIQGVYVYLAAEISPGSPVLLALRVSLGAAVLLVPTVMMGITLPLMAQALSSQGERIGQSVAMLYASNTAGAAFGAILTSYAIIPLLGTQSTTLLAALINFLVALGALELVKSIKVSQPTGVGLASSYRPLAYAAGRGELISAWLALCVGGVLSLGLEVVYVHLLSIVAGNSVYAFGLMLATFLVGLALGGEFGRRLIINSNIDRVGLLVLVQLALAAAVALGAWGWDMIPSYFASFAGFPLATSFGSREMIRGMVCALVMIPPTICIGMSYTIAMDVATSAGVKGIKILGVSAALNTFGNIAGVLIFGFFLLPWLGGLVATKVVAMGAIAIAVMILLIGAVKRSRWSLCGAVAASVVLVVVSPTQLNYELLSSGANVYFSEQRWGEVVDHAESIDGGLTSVARSTNENGTIKTLLTNGKFQGNDALRGEVQAQIGFAVLPLLHQPNRDNALVIGYGTGATSRVFHDAGFANLEIAELSADVVRLADENFAGINSRVSQLGGVETHITDGRNFLLLTRNKYDIISMEITSIWFAGAASLYNQEFYRLARSKLKSDGVLQQWVQLHHMSPTDFLTIIGTLRAEFSYVSLYLVGGQGILIATNDISRAEPNAEVMRVLDDFSGLHAVRELAGRNFSAIANELLLTPRQVDVLLDEIGFGRALWLSTDKNLRLEYSTPKANANPHVDTVEINMGLIRAAQARDSERVNSSGG